MLILMLLKISYGLSYRACEGMAYSIFLTAKIRVPCYSTICRGIRRISGCLPKLSKRRPKRVLIDSSGWKVSGEGEWKVKVHGSSYRRSWVKVHILVDSRSNEIMDLVLTPPHEADINVACSLLDTSLRAGMELLADGAYDGTRLRSKAHDLGIDLVAPPPRTAKLQNGQAYSGRNNAIALIELLGGDEQARHLWAKLSGYNHRVKAESAFSRLKRLFGPATFSRDPEAQLVELWLKAWISNTWLNFHCP